MRGELVFNNARREEVKVAEVIEEEKKVLNYFNTVDTGKEQYLNSLQVIIKEAREIGSHCYDYMCSSDKSSVRFGIDVFNEMYFSHTTVLPPSMYKVSKHALSQLCVKLGIPVQYIKKLCKSPSLDLVQLPSYILNTHIRAYKGRDLMFRFYKDTLRGVLSSKYSVLDTVEILNAMEKIYLSGSCPQIFEMKIKGYYLDYERLHIRMIYPVPLSIPSVSDKDLYLGLQIDSSDVGKSSLFIRAFIFKQVCTNGMVVSVLGKNLFQQRHVGIDKENFEKGLYNALSSLPTVQDVVVGMIESSSQHGESYDMFDGESEVSKSFMKDSGIPAKDLESLKSFVLSYAEDEDNITSWNLINGLTEYAQSLGSLDRRLEVEKYAGEYLERVFKKTRQ